MRPRQGDTVERREPADVTPCTSNRTTRLPRLLTHLATGGPDEHSDSCRSLPDGLDGRQGVHDPGTRAGGPRRGRTGCSSPVLPGAVLRTVLLPGPGQGVLRVRRGDPGRPDRQALPGAGQGTRHRPGPADVRGGAARRPLQHGRRDRRGRLLPGQVPQAPHPPSPRILGEVLLPPGQQRLAHLRHQGRQDRRLHLLRPPLPGGLARTGPRGRGDRLQPVGDLTRPLGLPVAAGAAGRRCRQRVLRRCHQPCRRRGVGRQRLLRHDLLRRPGGPVRRRGGQRQGARTGRPRPGLGETPRGPRPLAVLPRPPPGRVRPPDRPGTRAVSAPLLGGRSPSQKGRGELRDQPPQTRTRQPKRPAPDDNPAESK